MTEGPTPRDPREEPGGQAPPPPPPPAPTGGPEWDQPAGYQPQQGYQPQPPSYQPQPAGSGLSENVASGLSYVLGLITGLIFFLIDKRPEVRFHAMQSMALAVVAFIASTLGRIAGGFIGLLLWLFWIALFFTWIFTMIQAFQGRHFKLPVIGDFAEQQAGRPA